MVIKMNALKEAILTDKELGEAAWNDLQQKAQYNPIYKKLLKEGLFSDVAGALGAVQDVVWAAAQPTTIGREITKVIPTKNALERFPKDIRAYAWIGEGPPRGTGARMEFQDVKADLNLQAKQEWSESFVEDAGWDVLAWQIEGIGRALARLETEKVIGAYNAIPAAGLAAGSETTIATPISWANITDNIAHVEAQDFHPNIIAVSPVVYGELMRLDQFINSLYLEPEQIKPGVITHTTLGVTFVRSSIITKSLFIDINAAAVMLLRRDIVTKPYEDPSRNVYGVIGSERIGLGILRTKAVQRGSR